MAGQCVDSVLIDKILAILQDGFRFNISVDSPRYDAALDVLAKDEVATKITKKGR